MDLEKEMNNTTDYLKQVMGMADNRKDLLLYLTFVKDWLNIAIKLTKGMVRK